jgi:hypothetical protein
MGRIENIQYIVTFWYKNEQGYERKAEESVYVSVHIGGNEKNKHAQARRILLDEKKRQDIEVVRVTKITYV